MEPEITTLLKFIDLYFKSSETLDTAGIAYLEGAIEYGKYVGKLDRYDAIAIRDMVLKSTGMKVSNLVDQIKEFYAE